MKHLALTLLVALCAASCIKNTIPYPVEEIAILRYEGEGFRAAIDPLTRTVTATLDEPTNITAVKVTDVEITGPGRYTVGIDFTGTQQGVSNSVAFAAIGIANGEILYPGYVIDIKEVKINGEKYILKGRPYTCSDNGVTTRVNLYNEWITKIPMDQIRMHGGTGGATATPINRNDAPIAQIESIYITFDYGPKR